MRRDRANTLAVEKRWVLNILSMCSLRYSALNAHAPYCHLWPARLYSIFPHYLIISTMCVLLSSRNFVWNISYSKKNCVRFDQKLLLVFMWSTLHSRPILMQLELSRQFFEKYLLIYLLTYLLHGTERAELFNADGQTGGWTDRHDAANSRFS
jgi:hypothetical protein